MLEGIYRRFAARFGIVVTALIVALLLGAFLTGCNAAGGNQALAPTSVPAQSGHLQFSPILGNGQVLYVADAAPETDGTVNVYGNAGRLLRTVTDGIEGAVSLAFDGVSQLYVANQRASTVTVYDRRGQRLVRTITRNLLHPVRLAVDSLHNLYVIRQNAVNIYIGGKSRIMHSIKIGAVAMTLDSTDNLYVSTDENTVNVYAPGAKVPSRTITKGIDNPGSLALDEMGNLYVANEAATCGVINVYAPGKNVILRTIKQGICGPASLIFDGSGNLYVANADQNGLLGNSITIYAPGSGTVLRTITEGVSRPLTLAFDKPGNLYVANETGASITVYSPGSSTVLKTIRKGINSPNDLVLGT